MTTGERSPLLPRTVPRKRNIQLKHSKLKLSVSMVLAVLFILFLFAPTGANDETDDLGYTTQSDELIQSSTAAHGTSDNLGSTWNEMTGQAKHAVKTLEARLPTIDLRSEVHLIKEAPAALIRSMDRVNVTELKAWLDISFAGNIGEALDDMTAVNINDIPMELLNRLRNITASDIEDVPAEIVHWIEEHPKETALYVVEAMAFLLPGGVWGPVLRALGFTARGVKARTIAALLQSRFRGLVPKQGWFAHLVSAMMEGYGRKKLDGITRIIIKAGSWLGLLVGRGR